MRAVSLLLAAMLAVACGADGPRDADANAAGKKDFYAPAGSQRLRDMSPGKPAAPAGVGLVDSEALSVGVPASLTLEVIPRVSVDGVELTLEGGEGLELLAPVGVIVLGPAAAGEAIPVPIQVMATPGADHRLAGLVLLEAGGERQARAVSINVPVAGASAAAVRAPAAKLGPEPTQDAGGELVYSMTAETTVE